MKTSNFSLRALDEAVLERPINTSLLGDDFYKFSMGNFLFSHPEYSRKTMTWRFKNRTKDVLLADFISEEEFQKEYAHVRALTLTKTEGHYLRGTNEYSNRMFDEGYLETLMNLQIPEAKFSTEKGQLEIETSGPWIHSMHTEIPILKIVNGLFYRAEFKKLSRLKREAIYAEGIKRLNANIEKIKEHPHVTFSDFGNRRGFNPVWHEFVVERCTEELGPQFIGTSNVQLASQYDLMPIGTCAHELSMGITATHFDGTRESIEKSLSLLHELWWKKYGHALSISLPDTYGTDFTLDSLPAEMLRDWKGQRIDSKDPMIAISDLIKRYEDAGIDATQKMAIPSDGLDVDPMIQIANAFQGKIKTSFGWGTKLTNNLGLKQLSIVMKPYSLDGKYCVKLSDNIEKAMGDPNTVEAYKKALDYAINYAQKCEV